MSIKIFSDGSSLGNPGPGGWGVVRVFPNNTIDELGGSEEKTTNNRMELFAALSSFQDVDISQKVILYTDSSYLVNGITKWAPGWKERGWVTASNTPVQNRDLWETLLEVSYGRNISWRHVAGHVGIAGNERADEIANAFASGNSPKLFNGNLSGYPIKNILEIPAMVSKSGKAYSYLSLVDGVAKRHETWAECEKRVKGKSDVKFRKAFSPEDEKRILSEWGTSL